MVQEASVIDTAQIRSILASRQRRMLSAEGRRRAAVLVPLYEERGEYQILLIKRAEQVQTHQGQIAFPGGTWRPEDPNHIATALREAHEEIGLRREDIELLGELDDTATATSMFLITPVVGVIPSPYPFQIDAREIAAVLSLPLKTLQEPQAFHEETWDREDGPVRVLVRREGPHIIWGATARILHHFGNILFAAPAGR
jgi:8-oxo-dGTP pyrophosphatase MutT (NUDIX family)